MNITAIISIVISVVTGLAGLIFGLRQRDRRKNAEKAMEMQDGLIKAQTRTTKTVVKEMADERNGNSRKTEERKQKIREGNVPPDSASERLDRLRK